MSLPCSLLQQKQKNPVDSPDQTFSVISACDEIRNIPVKRDALELNSKKKKKKMYHFCKFNHQRAKSPPAGVVSQ